MTLPILLTIYPLPRYVKIDDPPPPPLTDEDDTPEVLFVDYFDPPPAPMVVASPVHMVDLNCEAFRRGPSTSAREPLSFKHPAPAPRRVTNQPKQ
ncbi:hypothetical protein E2542_SST16733 [Spatholobus suberectus]|nr:hypothetical protein E2542_SST16733 [Spatholobus suberectus]